MSDHVAKSAAAASGAAVLLWSAIGLLLSLVCTVVILRVLGLVVFLAYQHFVLEPIVQARPTDTAGQLARLGVYMLADWQGDKLASFRLEDSALRYPLAALVGYSAVAAAQGGIGNRAMRPELCAAVTAIATVLLYMTGFAGGLVSAAALLTFLYGGGCLISANDRESHR